MHDFWHGERYCDKSTVHIESVNRYTQIVFGIKIYNESTIKKYRAYAERD